MSPWELATLLAFTIGCANLFVNVLLAPALIGSHAVVYTDAAAAWLSGADPWSVGPPAVVFAGPPTMLVPFVPFTLLPSEAVRVVWVAGMLAAAIWSIRRLGLPLYWLAFPPLLVNIILGHVEVLVLLLLITGSRGAGLAALVKPYAAFPLLAERRWMTLIAAAMVGIVSVAVLPWGQFVAELPRIQATIARQNAGDSVFGDWPLMAAAVVALASLGPRKALWLITPVLWPSAQPNYKAICVPALPPLLAATWALPIHGATLAGLIAYAALVQLDRVRNVPTWLREGIEPVSPWFRGGGAQAAAAPPPTLAKAPA